MVNNLLLWTYGVGQLSRDVPRAERLRNTFINPGVIIVLPSIKCQRSVPAFTEPDKKPCRAETGRRSSALFFSSVSKKSHLISLLNVS